MPEMWSSHTSELTPFLTLIETRLGLQIREQDWLMVGQQLQQRSRFHALPDLHSYYQLLHRQDHVAQQEWAILAAALTNVESYFFRDEGQFALLRDRLLPELIERNRPQRRLRIWSAGCSSGEEPYSLAILIVELLPDVAQWDCQIWGTDINPVVLARAQAGIYPQWSLRGVSQTRRSRYFTPEFQDYRLHPHLVQAVQFRPFNLSNGEAWPHEAVDLILCRNVFIYFTQGAIATALNTLTTALRPGGYLLTGHAELYHQTLHGLTTQLFPESLVYQRISNTVLPSPPSRPNPLPRAKTSLHPVATILQQAKVALEHKDYPAARSHLQQLITLAPHHFEGHYLFAQLEANLGNHALAQDWCTAALAIQPLSIAIYYLLAQIATESGHTEEAKSLLRKVIYLDPKAIAAYYELSLIYQHEQQSQRAQKFATTVLNLLQPFSPDHHLEAPLNMTVAQLRQQLRAFS